jgi:hypothetical protein
LTLLMTHVAVAVFVGEPTLRAELAQVGLPGPVMDQLTLPVGVAPPLGPVTVAVKVALPPRVGVVPGAVTPIVGVALVIVTPTLGIVAEVSVDVATENVLLAKA